MGCTLNSSTKKRFNFPNGFVILFFIVIIAGILTYLVPSGQYEKEVIDGNEVVDPNSFSYIEQSPVPVFDIFKAIPEGISSAAALIIMILLIGASIRIFDGSGAIRSLIYKLIDIIGEKRSEWLLAALMLFFGSLGAFPGMLEATIPFAPLCVGIALLLGYDVIVGIAIVFIPTVIGWTAGPSNPWTVGIGNELAGLPLFEGFGFRLIIFVILMIVTILFVLRYARKVKKDPEKSIIYGQNEFNGNDVQEEKIPFNHRHTLILLTLVLTIAIILYGTFNWGWGLPEMSAAYLVGGIIGGIIAKYNANKIAEELLEGGKSIFTAAMAVGLARAIYVIMEQGNIVDTIIYGASVLLEGLPASLIAIFMFIVQTIINFFIPSGTGQAMATLPIMLPLADIVGVSKPIAILAFQFGDGISNLMYPTVGSLIAFLAYGKVSFNKWFKFIFPFILVCWLVSVILLVIATMINF